MGGDGKARRGASVGDLMTVLDQALDELTRTITVRNLRHGECPKLDTGFTKLDPEWTWVALAEGRIIGALLGAPCHGMIMLARLVVEPGYGWCLPRLLRYAIRDSLARGLEGYMCWLDPTRKEEKKIMSIFARSNAIERPEAFVLYGGKLSDLEKW